MSPTPRSGPGPDPEGTTDPVLARRRPATVAEAKALAHPVRLRILVQCGQADLTNKQLAERLGLDPGSVLYHVRQLVAAGFLEAGQVRTGPSGALEKPYRSTGLTWWLSDPLAGGDEEARFAPVAAYQEELARAGPAAVRSYAGFTLHLSPDDVAELDRRILAVLDEFIQTDDARLDQPVHRGLVVLHEVPGPPS